MGLFDGDSPGTGLAPLEVPAESRAISYQTFFGQGLDLSDYGSTTRAGINVTSARAMCLSAVFGSIRILTEGVSTLPVSARRGGGPAAPTATRQPAWLDQPNPNIGKIMFWAQMMMSLLHHGNFFAFVARDDMGRILYLVPLDPQRVQPTHVEIPAAGEIGYRIDGMWFSSREVLHIRGMSMPGLVLGLSPLDHAKETVGLGLAAQEFGSSLFSNGAVPGSVLETEAEPSTEARAVFKSEWQQMHGGSSRAHKLAVIGGGATLKQISITPEHAQFLETRGFQIADVARFFGVPPHLLGDATGSTSWGSGLAEQNVAYVTHSLRPWVERIEEAFTWLARSERGRQTPNDQITIRVSLDHLLRGDFKSQVQALTVGVKAGFITVDEAREQIGLPPLPERDPALDPVEQELKEMISTEAK